MQYWRVPMQWWLHLSSDFEPNSWTFFNHFNHILYNMALWFSSSYNAFIYRLTYTEVTGFKEACNNQKAIAMYFSTTENFLFHFLTVQSSARRWRSSEKPFPPWIPQLYCFPLGEHVTISDLPHPSLVMVSPYVSLFTFRTGWCVLALRLHL